MSLGGYKFAGYKCNKGSLSGTAFCLLMHKTRLKAFVEACAKTNSNWHFCKNSGTIDFEDDTNVIYDLDGNGYNYASFFQYGTESKYLAILTLPNQTSGYFSQAAKIYPYNYTTTPCNTHYYTAFQCASLDPFDDPQFFKPYHTYPSRALQLLPITNLYPYADDYATTATQWTFFEDASRGNTIYFGYAIKGAKIISFASTSDMLYLASGYINATVIGYDSMTPSSQSDTCNIFASTLRAHRTGEIGWSNETFQVYPNSEILVLTDLGVRYNVYGRQASVIFANSQIATTTGTDDNIPYSAVAIKTGDMNFNYIGALNTDGICSKGAVDIDFLAANVRPGNTVQQCKSVSNGVYLAASTTYGSGYSVQYYVGWDPSNPDITLDSSWTEYTV